MPSQLNLVVMSRDGVVLVPLSWGRPELFIGRDPDCDVCLPDAKVSRRHARLTCEGPGAAPLIADLGSRNGTSLDGRALAPERASPLAEGSIVRIGDAVLVLEERRGSALPRRVARGEPFAQRVDAEIARAAAEGTTLALVEVCVRSAGGGGFGTSTTIEGGESGGAALAVERAFARAFRDDDVLAPFGDGVWRALLPKTSSAQARQLVARLRLLLEESGADPALRLALFPRHGVTSEALALALAEPGETIESSRRPAAAPGLMAGLGPLVEKVAPTSANVLVVGETGVGKEVMARAIHERSPRAGRPLVCLNCAALSETLLDAELFGHEGHSFTGAGSAPKPGLLESAQDGTFLFDEVGEMPLALQAKLLRVLETREALRVGGRKPRRIDARFVFATHRDLEREVEAGRFRQDLYFRINTIVIAIPPLRERRLEIAGLASDFIAGACESLRRPDVPRLSPQVLALFETYSWPGNVRELRNVIERAVILSTGPFVTLEHLPLERFRGPTAGAAGANPPWLPPPPRNPSGAPPAAEAAGAMRPWPPPPPRGPSGAPPSSAGAMALPPPPGAEADERSRIIWALERCAGNQSAAAQLIGMSRRTFVSRMTKYSLPRPRKPLSP